MLLLAEMKISGMVCGRLFRLMPLLRCFRPALALVAIALLSVRSITAQQADPAGFAKFKEALPHSTFMSYVLTNVETNLASANLELMSDYAGLVEDAALREKFLGMIVTEFEKTKALLAELFDGEMKARRPRMAKTLDIREAPLRVLHQQQIALLREWRGHVSAENTTAADALLPKLLLSINAIASGLRTTG